MYYKYNNSRDKTYYSLVKYKKLLVLTTVTLQNNVLSNIRLHCKMYVYIIIIIKDFS